MADPVAVDANVIVAMLYEQDAKHDAFILVLQRTGAIHEMATFDEQLASMDGFRRFA